MDMQSGLMLQKYGQSYDFQISNLCSTQGEHGGGGGGGGGMQQLFFAISMVTIIFPVTNHSLS